jgi:protein-S-isoprenylcysteine O-methyltransferase Ste14
MTALIAFLRYACGIFALVVLAILLWSVLRAAKRPTGAGVGTQLGWLHSPIFYAAASAVFFGLCMVLWFPFPPLPGADGIAVLGALLCFPGLGFVLWGRLALGNMYFVSTGFGAQLFAGHRLITQGPYRIMRHPMYFGLLLAGIGGLLLYQTWTGVIFIACGLGVIRRARREEEVLSKEFGAEWVDYCRRVPMLLPRLLK